MALLAKLSRYQVSTEVVKDSQFLVWDRITLGNLTNRYPRLLQNVLFIAEVFSTGISPRTLLSAATVLDRGAPQC